MSHYLRTLCIPTLTYLLDVSRLKTEKQLLLLPPYLVTELHSIHTYLAKKGSRKNQGKQPYYISLWIIEAQYTV